MKLSVPRLYDSLGWKLGSSRAPVFTLVCPTCQEEIVVPHKRVYATFSTVPGRKTCSPFQVLSNLAVKAERWDGTFEYLPSGMERMRVSFDTPGVARILLPNDPCPKCQGYTPPAPLPGFDVPVMHSLSYSGGDVLHKAHLLRRISSAVLEAYDESGYCPEICCSPIYFRRGVSVVLTGEVVRATAAGDWSETEPWTGRRLYNAAFSAVEYSPDLIEILVRRPKPLFVFATSGYERKARLVAQILGVPFDQDYSMVQSVLRNISISAPKWEEYDISVPRIRAKRTKYRRSFDE